MKRAFTLVVFLLVLIAAGTAHASFRLVPFQYPTIQSAVDDSNAGDTIWIFPGEYRENISVGVNDLTIRGLCLGADSRPIIDGGTEGDVFGIEADGVALNCMTIRHGSTGIYAYGRIAISKIKIIGSDSDGIYIESSDGFTIEDTEILGVSGYGIYVDGGLDGTITRTTVRGAYSDCYYLDSVDGLVFANNQGLACVGYAMEAYGAGMEIRDGNFQNNTAGVYVDGNSNTIENNTITDSAHYDDGLYATGDDNILQNNSVTHCYYDCLSAFGDRVEILNNVISSSTDDYCMDLGGNDMQVIGNQCLGQSAYGLYFEGDDAEIRDNVIEGALYTPFYITGSNALVIGNRVIGSYDGMYVDGPNAWVEDNVVSEVTFCPISVNGMDPQVIDNLVSMGYYEALYVSCYKSCGAGEVRGNDVRGGGASGGYSGIYVYADAGMLIADNTVRNVQGYGLEIYSDECTISSNTAIENGSYDGYRAGFYIGSSGCTITDNIATDNTGPGFRIAGSDNVLEFNEAMRNGLEGFKIDAEYSGNVLNQNVAQNNHAEGFDNEGINTSATSNVATGNRTDCTDDGTVTVKISNQCADGSDFEMGSSID